MRAPRVRRVLEAVQAPEQAAGVSARGQGTGQGAPGTEASFPTGTTLERRLATPSAACIVPDTVFDAFGWCESDELVWRLPAGSWDATARIDGSDPARMVFVVYREALQTAGLFLPRELARLHAFGLGLRDEEALAPWAIDDATDGLFARRARPRDVLWLAADNLNALFWGLHDWVHFHNHGPFVERAWTELQCDATALGWLWINRAQLPIDAATWRRTRDAVEAPARARFAAEGLGFDAGLLEAERVRRMAESACAAPMEGTRDAVHRHWRPEASSRRGGPGPSG